MAICITVYVYYYGIHVAAAFIFLGSLCVHCDSDILGRWPANRVDSCLGLLPGENLDDRVSYSTKGN